MVYKQYYLSCDKCKKYYSDTFETMREVRIYSKKDGWTSEISDIGSYWDICPKCTIELPPEE